MAASVDERPVMVHAGAVELPGNLRLPAGAAALALFAHGSGSSRLSPRNQYVADVLVKSGMGTLLIDLLTPEEERADLQTAELRFNIGLLSERLGAATDWLARAPSTATFRIGYFGASTGAAAALMAAADRPATVRAIVSRGGRPDLAMPVLSGVRQPTLLIVGGADPVVVDMNRAALDRLGGVTRLEIVPGATHLFPEPGALERVAVLASEWFQRYVRDEG